MSSKRSGPADSNAHCQDHLGIPAQLVRRIAIVEPDVGTAAELRELLEILKVEVRVYPSAESYLQSDDANYAACVVAEVALPGLSGLDLLRRLRQRRLQTPVILLSAAGDVPTAVSAIRDGAFDFIEKPDVCAALLKRVACIMRVEYDDWILDDIH